VIGAGLLSIGEVLTELKADFPDVTVSKIRFLEAEGLIAPDRTASGYRKFSAQDVERLRFILTLQRDSYLPLRVIRERLAEFDGRMAAPGPGAGSPTPAGSTAPSASAAPPVQQIDLTTPRPPTEPDDELTAPAAQIHLTETDLAESTGLDPRQVRELREFGVICEHSLNGVGSYYDEHDLAVGRIARDFLRYGVEARHLRMFRHFAEREAGLFEQVVPAVRHRSPEARRQAEQSLNDLVRLGRRLRLEYLRQSLRATTGDRGSVAGR
jgi:DNA-binding transcriptional MerR regulator